MFFLRKKKVERKVEILCDQLDRVIHSRPRISARLKFEHQFETVCKSLHALGFEPVLSMTRAETIRAWNISGLVSVKPLSGKLSSRSHFTLNELQWSTKIPLFK